MTAAEVHGIVEQIRQVTGHGSEVVERVSALVKQIEAGGWVLGLNFYRTILFRSRNGKRTLRHPRVEWRNIAYWYNTQTMERVFYWDNAALTKRDALHLFGNTPPPPGTFQTFIA